MSPVRGGENWTLDLFPGDAPDGVCELVHRRGRARDDVEDAPARAVRVGCADLTRRRRSLTYVKSRDCSPSPWIVIGSPSRSPSTNSGHHGGVLRRRALARPEDVEEPKHDRLERETRLS